MVRDGEVREFLRNLSDTRLQEHLKAYVQSGMDDRAALAQIEIDRRRSDGV